MAQPRNIAEGATGIVALPASGGTALPSPAKGLLINASGNLGVTMADGSTNDSALVAVVAGQLLWGIGAVKASASNTAGVLALI